MRAQRILQETSHSILNGACEDRDNAAAFYVVNCTRVAEIRDDVVRAVVAKLSASVFRCNYNSLQEKTPRETQKRSGTETALTIIEFGEERILPDLDKQSATEAMNAGRRKTTQIVAL